MKILDSDHCVAILRGRLSVEPFTKPDDELAVTTISVGELTHGAHKSNRTAENLARLDVLLAQLTVLDFSEGAARRFGSLKAELERAGARLDDLDLQIGSIALELGAPLLTGNRRHFERIEGLDLENWLAGPAPPTP